MNFNYFKIFTEDLGEKTHDFANDTIKVALTNTRPLTSTNTVLSDITQIATGGGYNPGGYAVTLNISDQVNDTYTYNIQDLTITATGTIEPFRYIILYNSTAGNRLIGYWDAVSPIIINNSSIKLKLPAALTIGYVNPSQDFILTIDTRNLSTGSSPADTFTIPTVANFFGGTYNCEIDWGDGSSSVLTFYNQSARSHTYQIPGIYSIKVSGIFKGFSFGGTGDRLKILNISQFGQAQLGVNPVGSMSRIFEECDNLKDVGSDQVARINLFNTFIGTNNFIGNGLVGWDVSQVTNMQGAFAFTSKFNGDISKWDVSNITIMAISFASAGAFNQDLSQWNVSKVTSMQQMFDNARIFNQNLGSWRLRLAGVNLTSMLNNTGLSVENYSRTLIGWANYVYTNSAPYSLNLGAGGSATGPRRYNSTIYGGDPFNNAVDARNYLTTTAGWTITDGGQV